MITDSRQLEAQAPETAVHSRLGASSDVVSRDTGSTATISKTTVSKATISKATDGGFGPAYWSQIILSSLPLLLADLLALGCSLSCAYGIASWLPAATTIEFSWLLMLTALTMSATFAVLRLYPGTGLNAVVELGQVGLATTLLLAIFLIAAHTFSTGTGTAWTLVVTCIILLATVPVFRGVARKLASPFHWWGQPVLVFGDGATAQSLYHYYLSHPRLGIRPVAIVEDLSNRSDEHNAARTSHWSNRVKTLRRKHNVFWAVVSTPLTTSSAAVVRSYSATFPYVLVVPDAEGMPNIRHQMFDCGNLPGILITNTLLLPLPRLVKSLMDYILVIIGGVLCLPLIATIVLAIKLTSRGPATYAQQRIGKGGRPFWAWKFRTMVVDADQVLQQYLDRDPVLRAEWERDHKLKNDPRVTAVGYWLRKTSLDELPQLWNVLLGEMSLVGPRPIVTAEIPKYGDWFELYEQTTPGITGLWQISGRNNTTYDLRVALDARYVLNWSPWLDLYILARTIKVVLCREGAY